MKAVLMSIRPKWIAKILNGEKTIEVRKSFTASYRGWVYIYCTKDNELLCQLDNEWNTIKVVRGAKLKSIYNGKVVARFYCDNVDNYVYGRKWSWKLGEPMWDADSFYERILKDACLTNDELRNYVEDVSFSAIHISELEIFDEPKELSEFNVMREYSNCGRCPHALEIGCSSNGWCGTIKPLTKAPQSRCYIEVDNE